MIWAVGTVVLKELFEVRTWWLSALLSAAFVGAVWVSALIGVLPGLE